MVSLGNLENHIVHDFILEHECCLCHYPVHGGEARVVENDGDPTSFTYGLPLREAHIHCAVREGAVSEAWVTRELQAWCDRRNEERRRDRERWRQPAGR